MKIPGPDHPITIESSATRVVVRIAGRVVADSQAGLTLREAGYPPVLYLPRSHVDMSVLEKSETVTYCPYKGECRYFHVSIGGARSADAVWTYESAYPAVILIQDYLAFFPERVDSINEYAIGPGDRRGFPGFAS